MCVFFLLVQRTGFRGAQGVGYHLFCNTSTVMFKGCQSAKVHLHPKMFFFLVIECLSFTVQDNACSEFGKMCKGQ